MRKLSLLSGFVLALALVAPACGGGGDDDDDDDIVVTPDANTGGDPDAAADTPDATPGMTAENLGQPCGGAGMVACPNGEACVVLQDLGSQTEGFCTISCGGQMDTTTCSNGYTGGGTPACALQDNMGGFSCAVLCTVGGSGECAVGMVCTDTEQGTGICTGDEGL